jgi:hypothetical protein
MCIDIQLIKVFDKTDVPNQAKIKITSFLQRFELNRHYFHITYIKSSEVINKVVNSDK